MSKTTNNGSPLFGNIADLPESGIGTFWGDRKKLTFADMFCGIGGFHQAGKQLGMECVFACDIDADCRAIYTHNYGLKPEADICLLDPNRIPDHDILCAGFPCQPFSIIGDRGGFDDARGTLFFELAKIIKAKQPPAFVLENVKQLASHNKGETLRRILEILRDLDYFVKFHVLNALNFGLPQKRERILIVGFRHEIEGFDWPARRVPMTPLAEILEKKPDKKFYVSERIKRARMADHQAATKPAIWHENKGGNISSHPFSCALRAGASYNYLLVDGERRLTPRELLRLQGFPEDFAMTGKYSSIRKQAGNSVPVPMVKAVLEKVKNAGRDETQRKRAAA